MNATFLSPIEKPQGLVMKLRSRPRARRRPRPRKSRSFRNETNRTNYLQDIGLLPVAESQCTPRTSTTTRTIPNF